VKIDSLGLPDQLSLSQFRFNGPTLLKFGLMSTSVLPFID
jgi:hypothetical protein